MAENGLKLLMGINPVDRVLTKNNSFHPKWPETYFLSRSTWLDSYWPGGLGFDKKWRFWPEMAWNSFLIPVNMVWPVLTGCTRFWPKMMVLNRKGLKLIFIPGRHGLTRWTLFWWKDAVDSRKIYFWIFKFFLNFFGFL